MTYINSRGFVPEFVATKAHYANHPVLGRSLRVEYTADIYSAPTKLVRIPLDHKPTYREMDALLADAGFKLAGPWRQRSDAALVAKAARV